MKFLNINTHKLNNLKKDNLVVNKEKSKNLKIYSLINNLGFYKKNESNFHKAESTIYEYMKKCNKKNMRNKVI